MKPLLRKKSPVPLWKPIRPKSVKEFMNSCKEITQLDIDRFLYAVQDQCNKYIAGEDSAISRYEKLMEEKDYLKNNEVILYNLQLLKNGNKITKG